MTNAPGFWDDQDRSRTFLQEKATLEKITSGFSELETMLEDGEILLELAQEENDLSLIEECHHLFEQLETKLRQAEIQSLLSEEADENDAILEINSGAGGTEACDWADMIKRMYLHWCTQNGYKTKILEEHPHEEAGIKSTTIEVKGMYAYGYLKSEIGVHRLVRISPFDSNSRRHTSFASVHVSPDIDDSIQIDIQDSDLRVDTFRASGAGGQHVNTTDSAVRITHIPTGLVVSCQNERSQHKNKARAMKMLAGKLYQYELEKKQAEADNLQAEKKKIEWGSQIRSYVLHPYKLIKDVRTMHETSNVNKALNGHLMPFMEAFLSWRVSKDEDDIL